jgi:pimeloyl-ACP methyl ester carboxylesterase
MGSEAQITRGRSDFTSRGVRCAGDLYLPAGIQPPPVVMMAHGFGAERSFRLPAYAERFAQEGLATYLFDYRSFGDSEGEPRNYASPRRHLRDWQAAVAHVRSLPEVDGSRLALWGTSFSGGHAIVTAAHDPDVMALVVQAPFVDSLSTMAKLGGRWVLRAAGHGLQDLLRAATGRSPHYVKIYGRPDEFAVLNTPDSWSGYQSILPEGSSWENRCPARVLLAAFNYEPIDEAARIRCPAMIMYGTHDSIISAETVERMAARIRGSRTVEFPCGHFEFYTGPIFETAAGMQAEFLAVQLNV